MDVTSLSQVRQVTLSPSTSSLYKYSRMPHSICITIPTSILLNIHQAQSIHLQTNIKMAFLKSTLAVTLLSTLASTFPTTRQAPIYPPTQLSSNFRFVANVTDPSCDLAPSINNYVLSSYHIGAGEDYAVLIPNTTYTSGRIFYVNGTATEVRYGASNLLSDGGTPPFPFGVSILPTTEAVTITAGEGQAGIGLTRFPDPVPKLYGGQEGDGFYGCLKTAPFLPYGDAVVLFYKPYGSETPEGCADVTLLPECSEGSGAVDEFANTLNCYPDVSAIDWTYYNTD